MATEFDVSNAIEASALAARPHRVRLAEIEHALAVDAEAERSAPGSGAR